MAISDLWGIPGNIKKTLLQKAAGKVAVKKKEQEPERVLRKEPARVLRKPAGTMTALQVGKEDKPETGIINNFLKGTARVGQQLGTAVKDKIVDVAKPAIEDVKGDIVSVAKVVGEGLDTAKETIGEGLKDFADMGTDGNKYKRDLQFKTPIEQAKEGIWKGLLKEAGWSDDYVNSLEIPNINKVPVQRWAAGLGEFLSPEEEPPQFDPMVTIPVYPNPKEHTFEGVPETAPQFSMTANEYQNIEDYASELLADRGFDDPETKQDVTEILAHDIARDLYKKGITAPQTIEEVKQVLGDKTAEEFIKAKEKEIGDIQTQIDADYYERYSGLEGAAAHTKSFGWNVVKAVPATAQMMADDAAFKYKQNLAIQHPDWSEKRIDMETTRKRQEEGKFWFDEVNEVAKKAVNDIGKKQQILAQKSYQVGDSAEDIFWNKFVYPGIDASTSMAAMLGTAWLTKNTGVSAALWSYVENAGDYTEAINQGLTPEAAFAQAMLKTGGTAILEKFGLDYWFATQASSSFVRKFITNSLAEGITEVGQEVWQNQITKMAYDGNQDIFEGAWEAFIGSVIASGGATSFAHMAQKAGVPFVDPVEQSRSELIKTMKDLGVGDGVVKMLLEAMENGANKMLAEMQGSLDVMKERELSMVDPMAQGDLRYLKSTERVLKPTKYAGLFGGQKGKSFQKFAKKGKLTEEPVTKQPIYEFSTKQVDFVNKFKKMPDIRKLLGDVRYLKDLFGKDSRLFKEYPELKDIGVYFKIGEGMGTPETSRIILNDPAESISLIEVYLPNVKPFIDPIDIKEGGKVPFKKFQKHLRESLLHEIQHYISFQEGLPPGAHSGDTQAQFDKYKANPGEYMARLAEERSRMTQKAIDADQVFISLAEDEIAEIDPTQYIGLKGRFQGKSKADIAGEQVTDPLTTDPEQKIENMFNEAQHKNDQKNKGTIKDIYLKVKEAIIDRNAFVQDTVIQAKKAGVEITPSQDPYYAMRLFEGLGGMMEQDLETFTKTINGVDPKNLAKYLFAKRIEHLSDRKFLPKDYKAKLNQFKKANPNATDAQTKQAADQLRSEIALPMSKEDATQVIEQIKNRVGEEEMTKIEETSQRYYKMMNNWLTALKNEGIITEQSYNNITEVSKFYTPFNIIKLVADNVAMHGSKALNVSTQNVVNAIHGSEEGVQDVIVSSINKIIKMREIIEKNKVVRKLANMPGMQERFVPYEGQQYDPKEQGIITYLENGKPKQFLIDIEMADEVAAINRKNIDIVSKVVRNVTKPFKAGATSYNLEFLLSNVMRDIQNAYSIGRYGISKADWAKGFTSAMKHELTGESDRLYETFQRRGGAMAGLQRQVQSSEEILTQRMKQAQGKPGAGGLFHTINPIRGVEMLNNIMEEATRLGVFNKALREGVNDFATQEDVETFAAMEARQATLDFARMGDVMRVLNTWMPFLNARTQGVANMVRLLNENPKRFLMRVMPMVGIPFATTIAWNYSDDERKRLYDMIPQWSKDLNFHLIFGKYINEEGEEAPYGIKIPKGDIGQIVGNTLQTIVDGVWTNSTPDFKKIFADTFNSLSPVNRNWISNLNPMFRLPVELEANDSFFLGRSIWSPYTQWYEPDDAYTRYSTTEGAKALAKFVQMIPYSDQMPTIEHLRKPAGMQHAIEGMFAGVGKQALWLTDVATGKYGRKYFTPQGFIGNLPVVRRFFETSNYADDPKMERVEEAIKKAAVPIGQDKVSAKEQAKLAGWDVNRLKYEGREDEIQAYKESLPAAVQTELEKILDKAEERLEDPVLSRIKSVPIAYRAAGYKEYETMLREEGKDEQADKMIADMSYREYGWYAHGQELSKEALLAEAIKVVDEVGIRRVLDDSNKGKNLEAIKEVLPSLSPEDQAEVMRIADEEIGTYYKETPTEILTAYIAETPEEIPTAEAQSKVPRKASAEEVEPEVVEPPKEVILTKIKYKEEPLDLTDPKYEQFDPDSSLLTNTWYDGNNLVVNVNGSNYEYRDVPEEVYEEFKNAKSKGTFYNTKIKNTYSYQ
jgi:hypothetical protein